MNTNNSTNAPLTSPPDPGTILASEVLTSSKSILQSKTIWLNVLAMLAAFIPSFADWIAKNPTAFVAILSVVNIVTRFATDGRISIFPAGSDGASVSDKLPGEESGQGPGNILPCLLLCTVTALGVGALSSCNLPFPVSVGLQTPDVQASYNSESGITVNAVVRDEK